MNTRVYMRVFVTPLLLGLSLLQVVYPLANNVDVTKASRPKPIKRVAVIGAGIAGLSLAHALTNSKAGDPSYSDIEVSVFDSRRSLDYVAGSGVQLNGGLAVLGKINPDIQKAVMNAGIPIGNLKSRIKSWGRQSTDALWDYSIERIIRNAGGKTADELIMNGKPVWYSIMRGALQEALIDTLPSNSVNVCFGKTLTGIRAESLGAICEFSDGTSSDPFDLVVGCDGIKSAVKEYVAKGTISGDESLREGSAAALYSGIRIGYAVQDSEDPNKPETATLEQIFADGAYAFRGTFGNGPDRPPCKGCFVISLDENYNGPFKRKISPEAEAAAENSDWSQDTRKPKDETRKRMISQLERCNVPDEGFQEMVQNSDRFFELGVYFHNPFSFGGWSREIAASNGSFAVLCGDSAHAMPPFLGQGANQAIQDAYSLSLKVFQFNKEATDSTIDVENIQGLKSLLREYESARWKPTTSITAKAAILGYLETGGRDGFYSKFRDVFFKVLVFIGLPTRVLLDAATPKV